MSSTSGYGRGKKRDNKPTTLRKPGVFRDIKNDVSQDDEKPELPVNVTNEIEQERLEQDIGQKRKAENSKTTESQNSDNILQRAVNNPVFVPKQNQEPVKFNAPSTSSSILASAVNAPEFVPGKSFCTLETADERLKITETFVNTKMKQLIEDPGLLDEISISMASYLSQHIKIENDMIRLSDLLFEKCVSETMFQYTGSRLANYLDKNLIPKASADLSFRVTFLKRCGKENSRFNELINTDPDRACSVAMFIGELLMNYKTIEGETITKFLTVMPNIIKQLLACTDRKFLICAGRLLKLTGSLLDQNDEIFLCVVQLASDPHIDKTVQMLFNRVYELRNTSWGQHEVPKTPTYTQPNPFANQSHQSMYFPSMDGMLEEQAPDLPVFAEEEWNEYATDISSQDSNPGDVTEELYRRMFFEQYGTHYVPFATADNWSVPEEEYDKDLDKFIQENQKK